MATALTPAADNFYLLQPQLLTKPALTELLELRCVNLRNINTLSKDQLVEVFERVAVPLPQRKYRENRRGKLLTNLRLKQEINKEKNKPVEKDSIISIGFREASTSRLQSSVSVGDRLKPPPDAINYERKKIKLNSSSCVSPELDKIQIKKLKKEDSKNGYCNTETLHKATNNNGEQNDENVSKELHTSSSEKKRSCAKVTLKRSHSNISESRSSTDSESDRKKEKKKITWP